MSGLNDDLACARHRIPRVHYQIHQDLLKRARIGMDAANRIVGRNEILMSSRTIRCKSVVTFCTTSFKSRIFGKTTCCRLYARSCRVTRQHGLRLP